MIIMKWGIIFKGHSKNCTNSNNNKLIDRCETNQLDQKPLTNSQQAPILFRQLFSPIVVLSCLKDSQLIVRVCYICSIPIAPTFNILSGKVVFLHYSYNIRYIFINV